MHLVHKAWPWYWCTLYTSSCHSAASLTCVSLVSPRITCAMFIKCSLPNDSRKHLDVYWSGSAFEESKGQFLRTVDLPYIRYWQHIALVMPCRESEWLEVLCICRDRNLKPRSRSFAPHRHMSPVVADVTNNRRGKFGHPDRVELLIRSPPVADHLNECLRLDCSFD